MNAPDSSLPPSSRPRSEIHEVDPKTGWTISLKRVAPHGEPARARPVLIVPGYGMNSFIFGFHPEGLSLEEHLASRGLEVWSVDLRAQGRSRRTKSEPPVYGLAELAVDDVGAAIDYVLSATSTGRREVDLIGCSLGAALAFAHLACVPEAKVGSLVSLGGLVTWVKIHPAVRAAFASPALVGRVNIKHTRLLAGLALPVLTRFLPGLLSVYLNAESTDTRHAASMVQTVEDPNPHINRQIAHWIAARDLKVRGVNVSQAVRNMTLPFLCVVAEDDGIVPTSTARWAFDAISSREKELVVVGGKGQRIAHADLFLSHHAQRDVFEPVAQFLLARNS